MLTLIYVFVIVLAVVLLGLLALKRRNNAEVGLVFSVLALCVAMWLISNQLGSNDLISLQVRKVFTYLDYAFGLILSSMFLLLSASFSGGIARFFKRPWFVLLFIFSLAQLLLIKSVVYVDVSNGELVTELRLLFPSYILLIVTNVLLGVYIILRTRRKSEGLKRGQLDMVFAGLVVAAVLFFTANILLPFIYGQENILALGNNISYFATFIFVISVAIAIVKHKLFDLRLAAARASAYLLSLGFIAVAYGIVFILLSSRVPDNLLTIFYVTLAFITAIVFQPVKAVFDKSTSRIFFRDGYDPQEFLDQLNSSIVSNIEIGILLRRTTTIIEENLKSSFVQVVVPKTESTDERIVGTNGEQYSEHEANYMRGRLVGLGQKLVSIEDLDDSEEELKKIMSKHNISVLVHLSATSYGQYQTIAFMVLGDKKSGNLYTKSDLRIIDIIADELVIAIQNALRYEEIQEFNVTLQSKVNTATNKLKKTNEKLKTIDQTKDEFISMASHQLRTPLTSVKGYLSMVLEGDAGEITPEQKKLLDQAFVSSQRMVYLIADLLNVSRLKTGKFIIDSQPTDLGEVAEGEVSQLREQAKSKNIELSLKKPDDLPILNIDETKTRQVIMNFVDNALYYTPAGGKIEVELKWDKRYVYFTVKDNGLGVPEDEKKHLFEKFYRAKNARNIRPDGTGLGLFMAKKVIVAQGGNILFDSKEGKGSTFGFTFPLKSLRVDDEKMDK